MRKIQKKKEFYEKNREILAVQYCLATIHLRFDEKIRKKLI